MEEHKGNKSEKYMSVKFIILAITTIPLLLACVIITFFAGWTMNEGMKKQVFIGLRNAATGALLSLDNISMESFHLVGDDLYKGDYNVTQNMGAIDYYSKSNNVEITIFYDNVRKATTIKDKSGNRINNTTVERKKFSKVLDNGEEYLIEDAVVNNIDYYGYYMPVNDTSGNIIGMIFAGRPKSEMMSYIWWRINFIIIIAVVIYIVCVIVSTKVINKRFLKPITKLSKEAKELAKGNIDQKIIRETNDEFGNLTDDFAALMENAGKQAHVAERVANGDLTVKYEPVGTKDIMGNAIKKMVTENNKTLNAISKATEKMIMGVSNIVGASNSLAQGTTEQASAIEEITSSIEGIADSAKVNAKEANKANELVKSTREGAVNGNEQMKRMVTAMQDINSSSENISKIIKSIEDISFQTNIIALNASVEAARAGVYGKGFAVVAEEVRNLAGKSAEAAKNSAEMIEDSIKKVDRGSKLAAETAASLEEILSSIEDMASIINGIADASENQSEAVSQVNSGLSQIASVVQTNSATSEQSAAISTELSEIAGQLKLAVSKYKLVADYNAK